MTAQEIIQASMRKLGVYASGETPTTSELADGLSALQSMLRTWAGRRLVVFSSVKDTLTLVAGTSSYTWGSGGTLTTTRPYSVFGAYVLDSSNLSHPVEQITEGEYRKVRMKTTAGRPDNMFLHLLYPLSYIYLYPTPDAAETLYIDSMKSFTETSSFSALSDVLQFPLNYEEPIIYNLAIRIAPEFGKAIPADVAALAAAGLREIMSLNSGMLYEPVDIAGSLPVRGRSGYNINTDGY